MGICVSVENEGDKRNLAIEQQLRDEQSKARSECKLLLLGAGESGKSTVLKQMKLLYDKGYNDSERRAFKPVINSNAIFSMKAICLAMKSLRIPLGNPANQRYYDYIVQQPDQVFTESLDPYAAEAISALWRDSGVQACYKRNGSEYHVNDSAKYYFEKISAIASPNYMPTDQDILRSRVKTTGIVETTFDIRSNTYRFFDVGGQRSERKKWIHCFENVQAIIFLAAISEYDMKLVEDEGVNRMEEAFQLFESIVSSRWFQKTAIILFLNKMDLFEEKIYDVPIEDFFEDYEGGADIESAKEFFKMRFGLMMPDENQDSDNQKLFVHYTMATDTQAMNKVMEAVTFIIRQQSLKQADLI